MNSRVSPHQIINQSDPQGIIRSIVHQGYPICILHHLVDKSHHVSKEIAFIITSYLDKIHKNCENVGEVARIVALTVDLVRYPLCQLVQMLKNRDGLMDIQLLKSNKCLESLMEYVYQLVKHFQLFEYEYGLKEEVHLLSVLTKHDKLIVPNQENSEIYEQLLNVHYANCRNGLQKAIDNVSQMDPKQFNQFYAAYEALMTLNKKIQKSRWLKQSLFAVTKEFNQSIELKHHKKDKETTKQTKSAKYTVNFLTIQKNLALSNFQEKMKMAVDKINPQNI